MQRISTRKQDPACYLSPPKIFKLWGMVSIHMVQAIHSLFRFHFSSPMTFRNAIIIYELKLFWNDRQSVLFNRGQRG